MDRKSDYDKVYLSFIIIGAFMLLIHLYYYCHPLLKEAGLTHELVDRSFMKMRAGGAFSSYAKTKIWALLFVVASVIVKGGKGTDIKWMPIAIAGAAGAALYFFPPVVAPSLYLAFTVLGGACFCWAAALAARKIHPFNERKNDPSDTFEQCEVLLETPDSINIPTKYKYRGQMRDGWLNVVAPFRGSMVLGVPGSGKSFSIYGPFIEQMIAKGYSMFVYDYKYPDLTEMVYNELLQNTDKYAVLPEFCVINFKDPRYSNRCNPLHPSYIDDPADTSEIAELVMLNVNKAAVEKEDFFTQSAKLYLDAIMWFLRNYEDGRYCTFPHAIELMAQDYKQVFEILSTRPELQAKIKPFQNALNENAQDQLQGQIASAQIPLNKFVSPALYWVLTGDDFTLDVNNPEHPKILCVGNDPNRQTIYGTTLALFTSRMFKLINHKGKLKCGVLLDELPTIFIKGIDNLIATARSNKVAIVLGAQDKSQLRRDYGEKESEVIFNTVGNVFSGQVNGRTAEDFSKSFGKEFRKQESQTQSAESESLNISFHQEEILPMSTIESLTQGYFFGKVADNNDMKIDRKFFCAEVQRDAEALKRKQAAWQPLPQMTSFGEDKILAFVNENPDAVLSEHFEEKLRKGSAIYSEEDLKEEVSRRILLLSSEERGAILREELQKRLSRAVEDRIQANFKRIRAEVEGIIAKEYKKAGSPANSKSQKLSVHSVDPLSGL